ncbi:MAG: hypothetical protein WBP10_07335 [Thermoanaerobaculia bacterium]
MTKLRWYVILTGLLLLASSSPSMAELGYQTWGLRGGVGVDPDQGIIGVQWNLGNFSRRVRLQPNFELGFGDNSTLGNLTIPVHYRFGSSPDFTPYAGGGILLGYIDYDKPKGSGNSDWFIEPVGVVGIEWPLSGGGDLFLELGVSFGDAHDAKLIIGWMRRIR